MYQVNKSLTEVRAILEENKGFYDSAILRGSFHLRHKKKCINGLLESSTGKIATAFIVSLGFR
jgi:hypothetical protein